MRKVIARILAIVVCLIAAGAIYFGVKSAYLNEAIKDFIEQGDNFAQNKPVDPEVVEAKSADGEFIHQVAVYWKSFQDLNNQMDAETIKMLSAFDPKNLGSSENIQFNMDKMEQYRALVQKNNDEIEAAAANFIAEVSKINQEKLQLGSIEEVKAEFEEDKAFRKSIADIRKTIASYMYSSLEFLQSRQQSLSFAENGAIHFANPADEKYFYDMMEVIRQADVMLKNKLAENREVTRGNVSDLKKAFSK